MIKVEELKSIISHLPDEELRNFRTWFEEFNAGIWDKQFEEDVQNGKLDKLTKQAIKEFQADHSTEL